MVSALVVLLAVAGVSYALTSGGGPPPHRAADSATAQRGSTPSPSASPASPASAVRTPAAFAGSWSGQVRQPPTDTYDVTVTLAAGTTSGTVSYSGTGFSCSGTLTLTTATATRLTFSQGIVQGQSDCENGHVSIKLTRSGAFWFSFHSGGPTAAGRLTRRLAA